MSSRLEVCGNHIVAYYSAETDSKVVVGEILTPFGMSKYDIIKSACLLHGLII